MPGWVIAYLVLYILAALLSVRFYLDTQERWWLILLDITCDVLGLLIAWLYWHPPLPASLTVAVVIMFLAYALWSVASMPIKLKRLAPQTAEEAPEDVQRVSLQLVIPLTLLLYTPVYCWGAFLTWQALFGK